MGLVYEADASFAENIQATQIAFASSSLSARARKVIYLTRNEKTTIARAAIARGAVIVNDPNSVLVLDKEFRLEGFIFDASLVGQIDPTWLRARYREGLVIAAVNLSIAELGQLVDELSVRVGAWATSRPPTNTDFYSMLYFVVGGDNPEEVQRYLQERQSLLTSDGTYAPMSGVTSHLQISGGAAQVEVSDEKFAQLMFTNIMNIMTSIDGVIETQSP